MFLQTALRRSPKTERPHRCHLLSTPRSPLSTTKVAPGFTVEPPSGQDHRGGGQEPGLYATHLQHGEDRDSHLIFAVGDEQQGWFRLVRGTLTVGRRRDEIRRR